MTLYIKKMVPYFTLAIFFASFDRFFKYLAFLRFADRKVPLFGDLFSFTFVKNYNIAFSLPLSGPILLAFILVITALLAIFWAFSIKKGRYETAGYLTFTLFGAISNILDRIRYGFVIDYLDLKYFTVFNIADAMIVCGVFLFLVFNKNTNGEKDDE